MVNHHVQCILTSIQSLGDVERKDRTTYQFLGILCVVKGDSGVCAHALKLQEIPLAFLRLSNEGLLVNSTAMQVTMTQLAIAIIVVEVMGEVDACNGIVSQRTDSCPVVVKANDGTTSLTLRFWEMHSTTPQRYTGSYSNASLLVVVHSAIEVIHYTVMLHHIALMGKHLVV